MQRKVGEAIGIVWIHNIKGSAELVSSDQPVNYVYCKFLREKFKLLIFNFFVLNHKEVVKMLIRKTSL